MKTKPEKQYSREFYYKGYDDLIRFISYYYQIHLIRELKVKNVLEIGIGNKTVSHYLRHNGFEVTTCDCNEKLAPDLVGDIRRLPCPADSYDVVMACQILEHLPWDEVLLALTELQRITRRYVVISLPVKSMYFELVLKWPLIRKLIGRPFLDIFLSLPLAIFRRCSHHHHWEIGIKNYSIRKIRKTLRKHFRITKEVRPVLNPLHHFFVLQKDLPA
jgi:hypothetical protein